MPLSAFILACAPSVAPDTIEAIIQVESNGDVLAINANRRNGPRRFVADDLAHAVAIAKREIAAGNSVDLGLMQINSRNLPGLDLTIEEVFEPCTNIGAGATILTEAYQRASTRFGPGQTALRAALSAYNTGNFSRGFKNGYVARFFPARARDETRVLDAAIYAAETTVYAREDTAMNLPFQKPIVTTSLNDFLTPGTQILLDIDEAEALAVMEETAMDEEEAWVSNGDPSIFDGEDDVDEQQ